MLKIQQKKPYEKKRVTVLFIRRPLKISDYELARETYLPSVVLITRTSPELMKKGT